MKIYFSRNEPVYVLGQRQEFISLAERIRVFLEGEQDTTIFVPTAGKADPAPFERVLTGIDIAVTDGPIRIDVGPTGALGVRGSRENLKGLAVIFDFGDKALPGDHQHADDLAGAIAIGPGLSLVAEIDFTEEDD